MDHGFSFRPGTQDKDMFDECVTMNTYLLPDSLDGVELAVDIGMNIGSFSYAALSRGVKEIHGFEPDPSNFECATRNLRQFGDRAHLHHGAVWRSDKAGRKKTLTFSHLDGEKLGFRPEDRLTGCGHVLTSGTGREVPMIAFDDLIRDVTHKGARRINLMKVDCEGAEYPILLTSRKLHLVDTIIGEYHNFEAGHHPSHPFHHIPEESKVAGYTRYSGEVLMDFLREAGFDDVTYTVHPIIPDALGNFFARRKAVAKVGFGGKVRSLVGRVARKLAS